MTGVPIVEVDLETYKGKKVMWLWRQTLQLCIDNKAAYLIYMSPCLFNLYAQYIMENVGLDETQAVIKIPRRNINSLRYVDDTTLMAESEEELKSLLMKMKEESKKKLAWNSPFKKLRSWHPVPSLHGK